MNRKKIMVITLSLTAILLLSGIESLNAQREDLTGRLDLTPEDIERVLMPRTTRGPETPTPRGVQAVLAITVPFASGSAAIPPTARQNLASLGKVLQSPAMASSRFRITGHTDNKGHDCYNLQLSKKRAISIKQYLTTNFGIAPERLTIRGLGEEDPIADNHTPEGRQKNRRVEIVNLGN